MGGGLTHHLTHHRGVRDRARESEGCWCGFLGRNSNQMRAIILQYSVVLYCCSTAVRWNKWGVVSVGMGGEELGHIINTIFSCTTLSPCGLKNNYFTPSASLNPTNPCVRNMSHTNGHNPVTSTPPQPAAVSTTLSWPLRSNSSIWSRSIDCD